MTPNKELVAASSVPIVLSILEKEDSYGYEIVKKVEELTKGEWVWSEGMLYPILHKLEKAEYISSYWKKAQGQRKRKYYHLEDLGIQALVDQKEQWLFVYGILNKIWK